MKRAVITGMGVTSCLGNSIAEVTESLKTGKSGIQYNESYKEAGLRSHVSGTVNINLADHIDRKLLRFMGDAAGFTYLAMQQAIEDARVDDKLLHSTRTGLVMGSGGASTSNVVESVDALRQKGVRRVGPYRVTRTMNSSINACLATAFKIRGLNYSITSACATSAHCIGHAWEQIQLGKQDLLFCGGGEEEHWSLALLFDAMGALTTKYNDTEPSRASRPYCSTRDGFAIAGGGACVVVEELDHAIRRGAPIYAELIGYGATSDGADMVAPSGEGAIRCMQQALATVDPETSIDYLNTHGTSTPAGDIVELDAIREVFGDNMPPISSTKSLSGHSLGAAGVHEALYCMLMQQNNFICASAHIEALDEAVGNAPIVTEKKTDIELNTIMSNSFGFGGTNATLVLSKYKDR